MSDGLQIKGIPDEVKAHEWGSAFAIPESENRHPALYRVCVLCGATEQRALIDSIATAWKSVTPEEPSAVACFELRATRIGVEMMIQVQIQHQMMPRSGLVAPGRGGLATG